MTSVWDLPGMEAPPEPAFVKLDRIGDGFSGIVHTVTKQKFDDGSEAPQINFFDDEDGVQKDWTVGQTDAKRKCAELRPEAGDHITVKFTGTTGKFKHIDVRVDSRGYQQQRPVQPGPQQGQPAVNLPVHQQPAPVGQSYQSAPPPVYAVNAPVTPPPPPVAPPAAPPVPVAPPPPGVAPELWAQMSPWQRDALTAAQAPPPF